MCVISAEYCNENAYLGTRTTIEYKIQKILLFHWLGDVLICSGVVAYLGTFTLQFREQQITSWVKRLLDLQMICSEDFTLTTVLGEAVEIRQWNICGLPSDMFSVDNAIILK
jgi:hypothetical protein